MLSKEELAAGVKDPTADHYEEKFEFPFWTMVKRLAEEKDISYSDAAALAAPEYSKGLRIRDQEWTDEQIRLRQAQGNKEVMATDKKAD